MFSSIFILYCDLKRYQINQVKYQLKANKVKNWLVISFQQSDTDKIKGFAQAN